MSFEVTELNQCPICNNTSISIKRRLKFCTLCKEYFSFGIKQFFVVFGKVESFTAMHIDKNQLRLIARDPSVTRFCRSVDQLFKSDLQSLEVTLYQFQTRPEVEALAHFIYNHKLLKILDIALCNSEHLKIVLDAIEASTSITKLQLTHGCTRLNKQNAALVSSMLKNNKSIRRLFATSPKPDPVNKGKINTEFIYDGISENTTLESLSMDCFINQPCRFGNSITDLTLVGLISENEQFLRDAFTANNSIENLHISNSNTKIVSAIKNNTSIKTLQISRSRCENDTFDRLAEVLACHPSLTFVDIEITPRSVITPANIQSVCNGLQQSKSIKKFHMAVAGVSQQAIEILLNGTAQSKLLQELKLARYRTNRFPFDTVLQHPLEISAFTEALKDRYCALKILDLKLFRLHTGDTLPIALAFESNTSLEVIEFERTIFSSEALKVMQRWLAKSTQLKRIAFGDESTASDKESFNIAEIIKNNTTLVKLHYHSKIEEVDSILDALKFNDTLTDLSINVENNDLFIKSVTEKLTNSFNNWSIRKLTNCTRCSYNEIIKNFMRRNIEYQSSMLCNTIILIHNIARDPAVFEQLPYEIWLVIFEKLRYPGLSNFKLTADKIFTSYTTKL